MQAWIMINNRLNSTDVITAVTIENDKVSKLKY